MRLIDQYEIENAASIGFIQSNQSKLGPFHLRELLQLESCNTREIQITMIVVLCQRRATCNTETEKQLHFKILYNMFQAVHCSTISASHKAPPLLSLCFENIHHKKRFDYINFHQL